MSSQTTVGMNRHMKILSRFEGGVAVKIVAGKSSQEYIIRRMPSQISDEAFQVMKMDGTLYWVRPLENSCDCADNTFREKSCKHIDAINALVERGHL